MGKGGSTTWDEDVWKDYDKAEDTESSDSGGFVLSEEVVFLT